MEDNQEDRTGGKQWSLEKKLYAALIRDPNGIASRGFKFNFDNPQCPNVISTDTTLIMNIQPYFRLAPKLSIIDDNFV